jgi:ABC-type glycerol-3-phosphate transport system substrate-binding protein
MVFALLILAVVLGSWSISRQRSEAAASRLQNQVQAVLDLEHEAVLNHDGSLFASLQVEDPAWLSIQLQSEHLAFARAERTVTRADQLGSEVWANVTWEEDGALLQRLVFLQWVDGALQRTASAQNYWLGANKVYRSNHSWGTFIVGEGDEQWGDRIASAIDRIVRERCDRNCHQTLLPVTVRLTGSYDNNPLSSEILLPSPRLLALDEAGQPAELFWDALERALLERLLPAHIRFALPDNDTGYGKVQYRDYARAFMQANPGVTVDIFLFDELAEDVTAEAVLPQVDAALMRPTIETISAGLVQDLTPFVEHDTSFNSGDFYEQIWRGAWWQDRLWFVPANAEMHLLFYDYRLLQDAGVGRLETGGTWEGLDSAFDQLLAHQGPPAFMDGYNVALYAYAFNWQAPCDVGPCLTEMTPSRVAAALAWYQEKTGDRGQMVELATIDPYEREIAVNSFTSVHRKVGIWVDRPTYYEYQVLIEPLGVAAFPRHPASLDSRGDVEVPETGVSPMKLDGYVMSHSAANPYWTWQWLKYLSLQPPAAHFRHIPARPSVAWQHNFWNLMPKQLGDVMRAAFPYARPIMIGEEGLFAWEQLERVVEGESPSGVAQSPIQPLWFGPAE